MAESLTGGLAPTVDEISDPAPTDPDYREGVSLWMWDDAGRFGFPRLGVEAVGSKWQESFGVAVCMALPGGRIVLIAEDGAPHGVADAEGRPRVLGAGGLRFECVEPFQSWRVHFEGRAVSIDVHDYLAAGRPRPIVGELGDVAEIQLTVDAQMATPPWVQGTHSPEGGFVAGEHRFEQLCTVSGQVDLDGERTGFEGGGLRVHRKGGVRGDYDDFYGHVWQSARFPSGRAFGFMHYKPRPDGSAKYREGWVLDGGEITPARVEATPWMTRPQASGEDVGFVLSTPGGEIEIEGETFVSCLRPPRQTERGTTFPLLQSGIARYRWGDEESFGMIERSAPLDPSAD